MAAITVALLGGGCSGKTSLGLALTHQLNTLGVTTTLVPEHLRIWCEREGRAPLVHELAAIASEQSRQIAEAAQGGVQVVVADTTALVVAARSEVVFNDTSLHPASLAQHSEATLTLLMGIDFAPQANDPPSEGTASRAAMDAVLRRELQAGGIPFQTVYGPVDARLQHALRAVGVSLGRPLAAHDPLLESGTGRWSCENCSDPDCERRLFSGLVSHRPA
jgi:HTH-type transcriptional repressor of NAD biosynthesis genes